ncbi:Protein kinase superfamily protein [Raphanus sativus]|uniref:non-specific serine/threonine protein kinase n=1 Tax=Raphanus sativus TaxID=3726 RepID=A0A6J0MT80_RAPSA|nr:receptor-like cytosolic serine/threonine-protein kinase RBK2 [Raphanus sativus]XP_056861630.1 receptor-like cytosolic serine/threonine-protein kinase RBK2 [Raphanus sativus]KAJ4908173.1 Protein kinase superfamily protein [Raphanus sativus]
MERVRESSETLASTTTSSSSPSCNVDVENRGKQATPLSTRRSRAGFSDSFSSHDLQSFCSNEENIKLYPSKTESDDDLLRSIESETSCPVVSTSDSSSSEPHHHSHHHHSSIGLTSGQWRGRFVRLLKKGSSAMPFNTPLKGVPKLTRRKSKRIRDNMVPVLPATSLDTGDLFCFKPSWRNYSLQNLLTATNGFSRENVIGEGGYAEVYKGQMADGQIVAIKKLTRGSAEEMTMDYLSELGIIVHVDHPNIAKLIGYCVEGGMHLVLQLSPNGSLASLLYEAKEKLSWSIRYKVAVGTAEGLFYLHEGCQRRIIHKDIKASNILLTENFEAQISDFGLAKWLPDQWTHHTVSKIEGTFGYLPPEFFMHGIVDEKTDVYAYGVLLLELITGRQALDSAQHSLVMWAKPLIKENKIKQLVDPVLGDDYDLEELERLVFIASLCIHQTSMNRPHMNQIVEILRGDKCSLDQLRQRQNSKLQRTYSEELLDNEEYNSTRYLNDINRHMETVLGTSNDS